MFLGWGYLQTLPATPKNNVVYGWSRLFPTISIHFPCKDLIQHPIEVVNHFHKCLAIRFQVDSLDFWHRDKSKIWLPNSWNLETENEPPKGEIPAGKKSCKIIHPGRLTAGTWKWCFFFRWCPGTLNNQFFMVVSIGWFKIFTWEMVVSPNIHL